MNTTRKKVSDNCREKKESSIASYSHYTTYKREKKKKKKDEEKCIIDYFIYTKNKRGRSDIENDINNIKKRRKFDIGMISTTPRKMC